MRVLVTGLRGTVGRALHTRLTADRHDVVGWDRGAVPIDDYDRMDRFVGEIAPDAVVHLAIASLPTGRDNEQWLVNTQWANELAWICRQRALRFLHASTVMVFSPRVGGPFTPASEPDADEGYGLYKRLAEERVMAQYPDATIVRLGWQIGESPGSNNMIDYFTRQVADQGSVRASSRFVPACSLLADTAQALVRALTMPPSVYMVDSNDGWSHYRIACALAPRYGWKVEETVDWVRDERMIDPRLGVPTLTERLGPRS